jgi:hypothetical protein
VATVIEEAEASIRTIHEWHSERAIKLWVSLRTLPKRIQTSFLREGWTGSGLKGLVHVNDYPEAPVQSKHTEFQMKQDSLVLSTT